MVHRCHRHNKICIHIKQHQDQLRSQWNKHSWLTTKQTNPQQHKWAYGKRNSFPRKTNLTRDKTNSTDPKQTQLMAKQLSGRRVVELGLLSKELADGCNYCRTPLQLSNCWKETLSGLGSFLYITLWQSFHKQTSAAADLLVRSENWLFSPKQGWWPIIFFA